jgi:hypothetical protein
LLSSVDKLVLGQSSGFKTYVDHKNHFSFEIPSRWTITADTDTSVSNFISTCRPTTKEEMEDYGECFDGIVFYILLYKTDLGNTLEKEGGYQKYDSIYVTTDRVSDSVRTENIKGANWTGIYHNNICGISCKETGFHAAAGQCDFFYFSNNKETIGITTTGRGLDVYVKSKLLETFRFN